MNARSTLEAALQNLAQQQGASMDALQLKACLASSKGDSIAGLRATCSALGIPAPIPMNLPDRARLPLLALHEQHGWGVIIDMDTRGAWQVTFAAGTLAIGSDELRKRVMAVNTHALPATGTGFHFTLQQALRQYRGVLVEAALATVFIGMLTLCISLFSMQVYDRVIPTRSNATLIILGGGVTLAIFLELLMKLARSRIMDSVAIGMDSRLSRDIFQRLLSVRIDQMPGSVGSLAGQIRGYENVRSFYTASTLFTLVDFPLALLFTLIIGMLGSPLAALVPLLYGVIAVLSGIVARRRIDKLAMEGAQSANLKTGLLVETVEGAETIKAGAGSWKMLSRWINVTADSIRNDVRMRHVTENLAYIAATLQQLSYASLVALGAWLVMRGEMTMGSVIAMSILSGRIMAPVLALPGLIVQHSHAKAAEKSLERLYDLKADNDGIERPLLPPYLRGHFVLDEVRFNYPGSPHGLQIGKLNIMPGERIGIMGQIGAGKSTLLRMLAGLYTPQAGSVLLDGLNLAHINRQVVTEHIGYLQQEHRLFMGTLRDNLLIGLADPGDAAIHAAMQRSGLSNVVARHPKGLDLPIMEGGKGLSGGQRQLLAFTRLLLAAPGILLLDEPTASMDAEQEQRCLQVLGEEMQPGKTLIIVTHKASLLALVDRLIIITGNQIVLDGPRDAVLQHLRTPPGSPAAQRVQVLASDQPTNAAHSMSLEKD